MAKISKKELLTKSFVALNLMFKEVLKDDPEFAGKVVDNQAVTQYIVQKYGKASSENIIKEMESRGMLDSGGPSDEQPAAPAVKTTPASAAHAAAKAAVTTPKFAQPPAEEPAGADAEDSEAPDVDALLDFMANNHGGLYRDGQWLRTGTGLYVCPYCLESAQDYADITVADSTKKIGPHAKTHQKKERSVADVLLESLPAYSSVQKPTHGGVDDSKPTDVPLAGNLEPAAQSDARTSDAQNPAMESVQGQGLLVDNSEVLKSIEGLKVQLKLMETTLATALVVVLSLPEEQRQQLYTRFAADKVGVLSEILTRKI